MRGPIFAVAVSCLAVGLVLGLSPATRAQDEFAHECQKTSTPEMCSCIASHIPADQRAVAIDGLRKSNQATREGGMMPDPSTLTQEQMRGMQIVVTAQASCM